MPRAVAKIAGVRICAGHLARLTAVAVSVGHTSQVVQNELIRIH
jgi:hypothetical protein